MQHAGLARPEPETIPSRVTGNRVQIPLEVRRTLDLQPGDRLVWITDATGVRVTTARALAEAVWAKNTGGDAGDSGEYVRAQRDAEEQRVRHTDEADWAGVDTGSAKLAAALFPGA
ncbi:hypothetical protein GCM10010123_21720 [Pilimelia anulata]|uniref:SpoVT-AbrB domain-containing protein n=1 Tax=Pilimelia anulata TaxID=53371 RepID=A0A8J3B9T0_9ACTN|nr:AbrB/MazE/SpoVT family DNA-binding domain-containing protein [Pilimelia anulata]GGJ91569.1 hypothetical protein GCM10010123_21720 [Pilimelia anulata]